MRSRACWPSRAGMVPGTSCTRSVLCIGNILVYQDGQQRCLKFGRREEARQTCQLQNDPDQLVFLLHEADDGLAAT